jgi:hypothetical protein
MSFQLYLRPHPRALYLVSSTTALVLKQPESHSDDKAEIELLALQDVDLAPLVRINKASSVTGVLGLLSIPVAGTSEVFLLVATAAIGLPPVLPGTTLTPSKLLAVEFHCLTSGESVEEPRAKRDEARAEREESSERSEKQVSCLPERSENQCLPERSEKKALPSTARIPLRVRCRTREIDLAPQAIPRAERETSVFRAQREYLFECVVGRARLP